jgi:LPXTG-site transpeptidase (sortase) family protein
MAHHEHIVVHFKYDWMNQIWERKYAFFGVFMVVLLVTYGALYAMDFYPEPKVATSTPSVAVAIAPTTTAPGTTAVEKPVAQAPITTDPLPVRLIIDKLNRDVRILNPKTDTVAALDAALLEGVARHPDSATFAKVGTMFLLGHSSYLPTVHNKNFQAFNGIQKLEWGDEIRVQSKTTEYVYRVQKVYEVKASLASADIQWQKSTIILVTCDSFGSKDDRFVVEGYLIKSYPIGQKDEAVEVAD